MAIGCGANCAKLIILLINIIFMVIGIVLLGFGIFLVIDTKALHNEFIVPAGASANLIIISAGVILVVGLLILFISIVGCCATTKEHTGCLTFYAAILIFLLILQVVAVILAGAFYNQIMSTLDKEFTTMVEKQYGSPQFNETTSFIDTLQNELYCCGITTEGPLDWKKSDWAQRTGEIVPDSCCTKNGTVPLNAVECRAVAYDETDPERSKYVYTQGCDAKVDDMIKHYVGILVGVVIGVVVVQFVFIVIICLLKSSITRGYEYV